MSLAKMIQAAQGEVGYLEKKSNSQLDSKTANAGSNNFTKYGAWYDGGSLQGQAWCDMFVSWCAAQAGEGAAVGCYAYCPSHVNFFRAKGQYFTRGAKAPQAGDIIFFTTNGSSACHVGIVESVSGSKVTTIEGNTSGASTLVSNGGGVCRKSYSLTSTYILGYGRPAYSSGTTAAPTASNVTKIFTAPKTYRNGSTEEIVYADTALTTKTGSLNKRETCKCLGIVDGRYLVYYQVDGTDYYKTGFVEYSGGVSA